MRNPITWRNVQGQSRTGHFAASRMLDSAASRFDASLGSLRGMLSSEQSRRSANRENTIDNNTAAYLDQLAAAQSVDGLENQSADLAAMRDSFGNMIDRDATRGALQNRMTALRTEANAARNFELGELNAQADPVVSRIEQLTEEGKFEEANAMATQNQDLLSQVGKIDDVARGIRLRQQGIADQTFADDQRQRTRDGWLRDDERRSRQKDIDATLSASLQDIEAAAASGESLGMGVGEAQQVILGNLGVDNLDAQDRQYAAQALDTILAPYRKREELDMQNEAQADAQLATEYDIQNNIFAQDNPYNTEDAITSFFNEKGIESDEAWLGSGQQITPDVLMDVLKEGVKVKGKPYKVTPAMLKMLPQFVGTQFGIEDNWGKDELESALQKFVTSKSYDKQLKDYEAYQREMTQRNANRLKRSVFRTN